MLDTATTANARHCSTCKCRGNTSFDLSLQPPHVLMLASLSPFGSSPFAWPLPLSFPPHHHDPQSLEADTLSSLAVMLLGQAESGKSTLQKQFQLYYASNQLEKERPAWRPVVYFNIIKAVRMILEELDYEFSQSPSSARSQLSSTPPPVPSLPSPHQPLSATARGKLPAIPGSGAAFRLNSQTGNGSGNGNGGPTPNGSANANGNGVHAGANGGGWQEDLAQLRTKLLPLVAVEDSLARDLSGGVSIGGAGGRSGVFVRSGWQALVAPVASRAWGGGGGHTQQQNGGPPVNDLVARMLAATKDEVLALWRHPSVRSLLKARKLRLDESAALYAFSLSHPSSEFSLIIRRQLHGERTQDSRARLPSRNGCVRRSPFPSLSHVF